jgi:hypothetical protein
VSISVHHPKRAIDLVFSCLFRRDSARLRDEVDQLSVKVNNLERLAVPFINESTRKSIGGFKLQELAKRETDQISVGN